MLSSSSSLENQISSCPPYSAVYCSLLVQHPNVDEVQPIYVRENIARGTIYKIAESSLRTFLLDTPSIKGGSYFDVLKENLIEGKGVVKIHFYIPRDEHLMLGVIDHELKPICIRTHAICLPLFNSLGSQLSFDEIQSTLEQWPMRFATVCALFVKICDVDKQQDIYFRDTISAGPIVPMIHTSLRSFLETTPLVADGSYFEFVKDKEVEGEGSISFRYFLPKSHELVLGVLDRKSTPIKNINCVVSLGIATSSGELLKMEVIQSNLERWPRQMFRIKSSSLTQFRITAPLPRRQLQSASAGTISPITQVPEFASDGSSSSSHVIGNDEIVPTDARIL